MNHSQPPTSQQGFALLTTLIIVIIVGLIVSSNLRNTELAEMLAGSSIQRSRAFDAAEGALMIGEREVAGFVDDRVFASASGDEGVFSRDGVTPGWWRDGEFSGTRSVPTNTFTGVIASPEYVVEEIGHYVADGGSGIVALDRGSAGYGRRTDSGREVSLYRLQSRGVGSNSNVKAVLESLYVESN